MNALTDLGFRNINVVTLSTGGTLFLDHAKEGELDNMDLNHVFLAAPLVRPRNELLYQSRWVGPMLNNLPGGSNEEERKWLYKNRPWQTYVQLLDLAEKVERDLNDEGVFISAEEVKRRLAR
ncbi:MAG: hypothetical protein GY822_21005 [Deltaproteobacteria bacterium]|nr:hypothetical protein [Deltaproteobacteria bacterium]